MVQIMNKDLLVSMKPVALKSLDTESATEVLQSAYQWIPTTMDVVT